MYFIDVKNGKLQQEKMKEPYPPEFRIARLGTKVG
jgi:hypothetical protein